MTDSVYLTIFLPRYVCEAPERRQIKSIYLHSAFLKALDFLDSFSAQVPKTRGEVGRINSLEWVGGGGARNPRLNVIPSASVTGTKSQPQCAGP